MVHRQIRNIDPQVPHRRSPDQHRQRNIHSSSGRDLPQRPVLINHLAVRDHRQVRAEPVNQALEGLGDRRMHGQRHPFRKTIRSSVLAGRHQPSGVFQQPDPGPGNLDAHRLSALPPSQVPPRCRHLRPQRTGQLGPAPHIGQRLALTPKNQPAPAKPSYHVLGHRPAQGFLLGPLPGEHIEEERPLGAGSQLPEGPQLFPVP